MSDGTDPHSISCRSNLGEEETPCQSSSRLALRSSSTAPDAERPLAGGSAGLTNRNDEPARARASYARRCRVPSMRLAGQSSELRHQVPRRQTHSRYRLSRESDRSQSGTTRNLRSGDHQSQQRRRRWCVPRRRKRPSCHDISRLRDLIQRRRACTVHLPGRGASRTTSPPPRRPWNTKDIAVLRFVFTFAQGCPCESEGSWRHHDCCACNF